MRRTKEQRELEQMVQGRLAGRFPEVELVDLAVRGGREPVLTVFIDRAGGVDLELCGAVSGALDELRDRYGLEVSSPGLDRPLTRPEHFERAVGERVALRTEAPVEGRSNFDGRLAAAAADGVVLELEDGRRCSFSYDDIARAHVVHTFAHNGGRNE
jgi:ribosome maturation factor RimP